MNKYLSPKIALLAIIIISSACSDKTEPAPQQEIKTGGFTPVIEPKINNETADSRKIAADIAKQECISSIENKKVIYQNNMATGNFWSAAQAIKPCADLLKERNLIDLVKNAEIKSHIEDIKNPGKSPGDKALAMEMLARDYPNDYLKFKPEAEKLLEAKDKQAKLDEKKRKKSEGVLIGMKHQDVLGSSWGKPLNINKTTTAHGTHEQWVYGGNNYLYFEDGILTSIQN